jgi:hypothetical protein
MGSELDRERAAADPHIHMDVHEDRVFPIKLDVWMLFI